MEGVRAGVRRLGVHLAGDEVVARRRGKVEQIAIEPPPMAASAGGGGDHHPVDIDEALAARPEPLKIGAVIVRVLIEGEQERL